MNAPTHLYNYGHDHVNRSISSYWGECLIVVNSLNLWEAPRHKVCLVFLYATICSKLDLVDPPRSHNWLPLRSRHDLPHIIPHDGIVLLHHGLSLDLLVSSLLKWWRLGICNAGNWIYVATKPLRCLSPRHDPLHISSISSLPQSILKPLGPPAPQGGLLWNNNLFMLLLIPTCISTQRWTTRWFNTCTL